MLDYLLLILSALTLALSSLVTWHVISKGRMLRKIPFGALMLSLVTFSILEIASLLFPLRLADQFLSSLTIVLLMMAYSREVLHGLH